MIEFDYEIFRLINSGLNSDLSDSIFTIARNKYFWIPLYVFFFSAVLFNFPKRRWLILGLFIATVSISDFTSSKLIKNTVKRSRPCNTEMVKENMRLLIHCSGSYSFTSSHATNHFAMAVFVFMILGRELQRKKWLLILWAGLVSFAQVYVGAHFPLDVIGGAICGTLIAIITANIYFYFDKKVRGIYA